MEEKSDFDLKTSLRHIGEMLNLKVYSTKYINVKSNVISFWEDEGLLDKAKGDILKWRMYSLIDILWVALISEIKEFGLGTQKTKQVKNHLFKLTSIDTGQSIPLLEFGIIEAIVYSIPVIIVIQKDFRLCKTSHRQVQIAI